MASQLPHGQVSTLIERAKRLLLQPNQEWPLIETEPMTVRGIFTGWAVPLAAIGPLAGLIGALIFGYGAFGITVRPSIGGAVTSAVIGYAMALVGVWVISMIIDALAPSFGGTKDRVAATKVAAFSATAGWLAGVFQIVPALSFLGLLGLYSGYLLYLGLPRLMKAPQEKAIGYTAATIGVAIVVFLVIGVITSGVTARLVRPALDPGTVSGTVSVPGVGAIDLGKLDAASKQMEAAAAGATASAASGKPAAPTPTALLQALLPGHVQGWTRGAIDTASGGVGGIGGSKAEARYTSGGDSVTLSVADIGAMGAVAGIGQALNIQSNHETKDGYERTSTVDGRIVNEKWDGATRTGSYDTIVASRFAVSVEGTAPDAATLKSLADSVDPARLEALAKR